jgi:hypothetical protein
MFLEKAQGVIVIVSTQQGPQNWDLCCCCSFNWSLSHHSETEEHSRKGYCGATGRISANHENVNSHFDHKPSLVNIDRTVDQNKLAIFCLSILWNLYVSTIHKHYTRPVGEARSLSYI